jgi:hypothetical protein
MRVLDGRLCDATFGVCNLRFGDADEPIASLRTKGHSRKDQHGREERRDNSCK